MQTASTIALLVGLSLLMSGCDDDDGDPPADVETGVPDSGVDMADAAPPFNYIPLNDRACQIDEATAGVVALVDRATVDLIRTGSSAVGEGLEICAPEPMNGCPACALDDNPLNGLLTAFSGPFSEYYDDQTEGGLHLETLQAFFFEALRYPLRYLTTTITACADLEPGACPAEATHRVVLSQSKKQPCADGFSGCDHYSIEPESFDENCERPPMTLYGTLEAQDDGTSRLVAELPEEALDDVTFGFIVPIIKELPPDPETLTDDELAAWLDGLAELENRLDIRVHAPRLIADVGDDLTTGCARLEGWVPASTFIEFVEAEQPDFAELFAENLLPGFTDPEHPDRINSAMSFQLEPGTFASGVACNPDPCGETAVACDGDTLTYSVPQTRCALERPAGYVDGDAIEPSCTDEGAVDWPVDCAASGGTCADDACTVPWVAPAPGDLVVSELYFGPAERPEGVRRSTYHWVEFTNVADGPRAIDGCVVRSRTDGLLGNRRTIRSVGPLVIPPGGQFVMAKRLDPEVNGGVDADFGLGNDVRVGGGAHNAMTLQCDGVEIDAVTWADTDWAALRGASMQLDPSRLDAESNDAAESWCPAVESFGPDGALGTPGGVNSPCP